MKPIVIQNGFLKGTFAGGLNHLNLTNLLLFQDLLDFL